MKKILVTGGLGYVGGRILAHLLTKGEYSLYVSTRQEILPKSDFLDVSQLHRVNNEDLLSSDAELLEGFDAVIHLAAYNEIDSASDPVGASLFNIVDSLRLLQAAIQHKVPRFLYFSTAHAYGAPLTGLITEQTLPRPVHPYAITHRAFEDFVLAARDKKQLDGIVVRLSNAFGYPAWPSVNRWTLLVNDLCREVVNRETLTLQTVGLQERDFITLQDVANAAAFLIRDGVTDGTDGLFNLGGQWTLNVRTMAERVAERYELLTNRKAKKIFPNLQGILSDTEPLIFSSKKLAAIGFHWTSDTNAELDGLLRLCQQYFPPNHSLPES